MKEFCWNQSEFYCVVDRVTSQVLSEFRKDGRNDWNWDEMFVSGGDASVIHQSARFSKKKEAKNAIDLIKKQMKKNGETEFNFQTIPVKAEQKITYAEVIRL